MDQKTTLSEQDILLSSEQVQHLLGLSRTTVWRLARYGTLSPVRIGAALRFRRSEILALMQAGAPRRS